MILPRIQIYDEVKRSLLEDLGRAGDLTSQMTVGSSKTAVASLVARDAGVLCGLPHGALAFELIDQNLKFVQVKNDGDDVLANMTIASVAGNASSILSAERTALNFMCHLSGIANLTSKFAKEISHTRAKICCTRKLFQD